MKYKSIKIERDKYAVRIPKRRIAINVSESLNIVEHKGRWIVALASQQNFSGERIFYGNQTINRSQAIQIIDFLMSYINMVKPTEATALHSSIKASTNRVRSTATQLAGLKLKGKSK